MKGKNCWAEFYVAVQDCQSPPKLERQDPEISGCLSYTDIIKHVYDFCGYVFSGTNSECAHYQYLNLKQCGMHFNGICYNVICIARSFNLSNLEMFLDIK